MPHNLSTSAPHPSQKRKTFNSDPLTGYLYTAFIDSNVSLPFLQVHLLFPQMLQNKPMMQNRERLPNYPSTHNIFGIHSIRMVYLGEVRREGIYISIVAMLLFFSSKSNLLRLCLLPSFFHCFKICFITGYLTCLICSRRAHTNISTVEEAINCRTRAETHSRVGWRQMAHPALVSKALLPPPAHKGSTFQPHLSLNTQKYGTLLDYHCQNSHVTLSQASLLLLKSLQNESYSGGKQYY